MTRRFGRFLLVLLILAALQFIFGDARAAELLREGDEVTFALPGTQRTYCGRVSSLVEWLGVPHAWVQAGSLVARLPVAALARGCARPARLT